MTIELFELGGPGIGARAADGVNGRRYSTFSWRSRMALAHKGLEYVTRPMQVSDKASIAFSGQTKVPILRDGDQVIADSFKIAEYLERTYPDRPSLFGGATGHSLARFFNSWADRQLIGTLFPSLMLENSRLLAPADAAHIRGQFERGGGKPLEEIAASKEKAIVAFGKLLDPVRSVLRGQPFVSGSGPAYADHILFSVVHWPRITTATPILAADDLVTAWCERMLDQYGGVARQEPVVQ
jgi:glutathione S-transferase